MDVHLDHLGPDVRAGTKLSSGEWRWSVRALVRRPAEVKKSGRQSGA